MAAPRVPRSLHAAILACALAVGFQADAGATDTKPEAFGPPTYNDMVRKCIAAGGWYWICGMEAKSEAKALEEAKETLKSCAMIDTDSANMFPHEGWGLLYRAKTTDCVRQRDYIQRRW
jgi:hypothetical protein